MFDMIRNGEFYSVWSKGTALYVRWANVQGIGYPELMVLYAMKTKDRLTQKEIGEGYGLLKQTVNTVIRDLKARGYITLEPSKEDKREKLLSFTQEGEQYAFRMVEPLLCAEERVCKRIGYERMEQLQDIMELFNLLFEREVTDHAGKNGQDE